MMRRPLRCERLLAEHEVDQVTGQEADRSIEPRLQLVAGPHLPGGGTTPASWDSDVV